MVVLIIILLGFCVVNSIGSVAYSYVDPSDAYYKSYMEKLEGDITTDKVDFINKEDKYFTVLKVALQVLRMKLTYPTMQKVQ